MIALSWITAQYIWNKVVKSYASFLAGGNDISYNIDTTNLDPSIQSRETMIALSWITAQ